MFTVNECEKIFIDTGFLIALETSDDQHHKFAQNCWCNLLVSKPLFFTTSFILILQSDLKGKAITHENP